MGRPRSAGRDGGPRGVSGRRFALVLARRANEGMLAGGFSGGMSTFFAPPLISTFAESRKSLFLDGRIAVTPYPMVGGMTEE